MLATNRPSAGGDEAGALAGEGQDPDDSVGAEDVGPGESHPTTPAALGPATIAVQPAAGVMRLQSRPRMKVAKSGALKKPNSAWM